MHAQHARTDLRVLLLAARSREVTPSLIASQSDLTTGAVTALIDRLERAGRIRRKPHPTDRRSRTIELTADGRAIAEQVLHFYRRAFAAELAPTDIMAATRIVARLSTEIDQQAAIAAAAADEAAGEDPGAG